MSILSQMMNAAGSRPVLIAFGFESNSGGQALNSVATADELSETPNVRILNPLTMGLENLHIGVNSNLDHYNLPPNRHGWHLQLKNLMDGPEGSKPFPGPLYIVELGQGGSTYSQWNVGGTYRNKATARINAAVQAVTAETGSEPILIMFNSFGINDVSANTASATFQTGYLELLDYINSLYPVTAYFVDKIFSSLSNGAAYRFVIDQLALLRPGRIFIQDMQGLQQDDSYHLGYAGMKAMVNLKVAAARTALGT